jgi:preprotein translocase SecF subunit
MFRLFHDNNIDFLGRKAIFISISVALMLIGCVAVVARGFNLGVDFAGGSLYYVQFVKPTDAEHIRTALREQGVDTSKVVVQPISSGGRATGSQGLLIRLPQEAGGQTEATGIGGQKRTVLRALSTFNKDQTNAPGKLDINTADDTSIATEVRLSGAQIDPAVNVDEAAGKIVAFRNSQPNGIFTSVDQVRQTPDVPAPVLDVVANSFFAGKTDINSIGGDAFLDLVKRLDPLGLKGDPAAADARYRALRDEFITYRDKTNGGVISSIDELQFADVPADFKDKLSQYFYVGAFNVTNAEAVGAQVGADLRNRAIYVTLASLIGMLVFIALRFEWIYGVSAVLAVFHDVPVCLGFFALFGWEVNLTVVAALLTLIGYSVNDTIVIFDRIRETFRSHRRDSIEKVTNDAINQTLSRTVISSGTAFLTVLVLALFGGDVLKSFAMVLLIGIIVGTYSSIGIASPIMIWFYNRQRARRPVTSPAAIPDVARAEGGRPVRTAKTI